MQSNTPMNHIQAAVNVKKGFLHMDGPSINKPTLTMIREGGHSQHALLSPRVLVIELPVIHLGALLVDGEVNAFDVLHHHLRLTLLRPVVDEQLGVCAVVTKRKYINKLYFNNLINNNNQ